MSVDALAMTHSRRITMAECPHCEYNKKRAQIWRDEAYKLSGHPLPERDPVLEEREACAKLCEDSVEYAGGTLADAIRARGQALKERNT